MRAVYRVLLIALLLLSGLPAIAHEYPSAPADCPAWGTRVYVGAADPEFVAWVPQGVSVSACNGYGGGNSPYSVPAAAQNWPASNVVGYYPFAARNSNNIAVPSHCSGIIRRCDVGQRWKAAGSSGQCETCPSSCDDNHVPENRGEELWCVDAPEHECPGGYVRNHDNGQCEQLEECGSGEVYDPIHAECHEPCGPGESYYGENDICAPTCTGNDQIHFFTVGSATSGYCAEPLPESCTESEVYGYVGSQPVCADDFSDCVIGGGDYGLINGQPACIPNRDQQLPPPPLIPKCTSNEGLVYSPGAAREWTCAPYDDEPPEMPEPGDPDCGDLDGDGICNKDDSDIDGDGIPNSTDDDDDGDGVLDEDDGNPGEGTEEQEGDKSEVSGGGNCSKEPSCKGDAIQCAIVYQTYKTRCEGLKTESQEELDRLLGDEDPVASITGPDVDMTGTLSGVFNQTGAGGSCPAPISFTYNNESFEIDVEPLCDLATQLRPFIILVFSFAGFLLVLRAF